MKKIDVHFLGKIALERWEQPFLCIFSDLKSWYFNGNTKNIFKKKCVLVLPIRENC